MCVHIRDNKTFGCLTVRHGTAAKINHAKLHIFFQKCQKLQFGLCKNERLGLISV